MHGVIQDVFVQAAQTVEKGARLAVLEAMKMQHDIIAPHAGEVAQVLCEQGGQVAADALLFQLQAAPDRGAVNPSTETSP